MSTDSKDQLFLETVWSALPEDGWESAEALQEMAGMDDSTLQLGIDFLVRWGFAEMRWLPELQVRRKPGVVFPVNVIRLLRLMSAPESSIRRKPWLAERIACRVCGKRNFNFLGENQVECRGCSERQWFTIEISEMNAAS